MEFWNKNIFNEKEKQKNLFSENMKINRNYFASY